MYKYGESLYLKSDSSIRGSGYNAEIVSHPHSFNKLMSNDSWLNDISNIANTEHDGNGCHIHISRTAFASDKHYSLVYFLMHKMVNVCTKVGGRALTHHCSLSPSGKVITKSNKRQGNERALFLNETNYNTIEARFFKGTVKTTNLKAYVQLIESIIKYTKYHSTTVTSNGWFQYISKKSKKYKELLEVLGDITTIEDFEQKVTYREPKLIEVKVKNLRVGEMSNVHKVIYKDGVEYTATNVYIKPSSDGDMLYFYVEDYGYKKRLVENISYLMV